MSPDGRFATITYFSTGWEGFGGYNGAYWAQTRSIPTLPSGWNSCKIISVNRYIEDNVVTRRGIVAGVVDNRSFYLANIGSTAVGNSTTTWAVVITIMKAS